MWADLSWLFQGSNLTQGYRIQNKRRSGLPPRNNYPERRETKAARQERVLFRAGSIVVKYPGWILRFIPLGDPWVTWRRSQWKLSLPGGGRYEEESSAAPMESTCPVCRRCITAQVSGRRMKGPPVFVGFHPLPPQTNSNSTTCRIYLDQVGGSGLPPIEGAFYVK